MCAPWDTSCVANELATAVSNTVLGQIAEAITTAEQWLIDTSASWWVLVPSVSFYPDPRHYDSTTAPIDAVAKLHALILPITAVIATGGMLWNGLLMVLSRKPAPLVNALRGLWNTALWAGVGIFGTNLVLAGGDEFSRSLLTAALRDVGGPSLNKRLTDLLVPVTGPTGGLPVGLVILAGGIAMISAFIQALLMLFRDGSVLILAAVMPLAASGSFTNATNGWLRKVLAWLLALVFYKPVASIVYATAIWLTNTNNSRDPRVLFIGVAMMILAVVALPALARLFNWTVGGLQSGGGGLGMLATAGAAGMHAGASLRGASGVSGVNQHARYMAETFDRDGPSGGGGGPGAPPGGDPGPGPIPMPGSPGMRPPTFMGPATSAGAAGSASAGAGMAGASAGSAGTGAAMGASAATGPAAPVVAGAIAVTSTAARTGRAAAHAAADAAYDTTQGG